VRVVQRRSPPAASMALRVGRAIWVVSGHVQLSLESEIEARRSRGPTVPGAPRPANVLYASDTSRGI
jgi:hypothetical protein